MNYSRIEKKKESGEINWVDTKIMKNSNYLF